MTLPHPDPGPQLARRLGLADAVVLGLGSMFGAGVFATFAPAAAAAGAGLLIALAVGRHCPDRRRRAGNRACRQGRPHRHGPKLTDQSPL